MSDDRRQVRVIAMQALCQWDVQRDQSPEALREFLTVRTASEDLAEQAATLVGRYWELRQRVDDRIAAAVEKWDLSRISPVERNVMRVAVVELLERVVPPKVALNEAVEIGREYGGKDSPRFINGVLDVVFRRLQPRTTGND